MNDDDKLYSYPADVPSVLFDDEVANDESSEKGRYVIPNRVMNIVDHVEEGSTVVLQLILFDDQI